jgi:hypothetical protein
VEYGKMVVRNIEEKFSWTNLWSLWEYKLMWKFYAYSHSLYFSSTNILWKCLNGSCSIKPKMSTVNLMSSCRLSTLSILWIFFLFSLV